MSRVTSCTVLTSLASAYGSGEASFEKSIEVALAALMRQVMCNRVSLWRFDVTDGVRALRCFLYQVAGKTPVADDTVLDEDQFRDYFSALVLSGIFVSNDAQTDDRLKAMRAVYLDIHHIGASLDVPVIINGRAYGMVCCEQVGERRVWTERALLAARQTVTHAGLLLANERSIQLASLGSIPMAPL
jgi:GAF domain-containing protein